MKPKVERFYLAALIALALVLPARRRARCPVALVGYSTCISDSGGAATGEGMLWHPESRRAAAEPGLPGPMPRVV